MQERRISQRRRNRGDIKFPITDGGGCIVPFDRSRISERRLQNLMPGDRVAKSVLNNPWPSDRQLARSVDPDTIPLALDGERDFCISGELIASVNNIYQSPSPGRWKELELYQTPSGQYVCLEIWHTTWEGERDQYWLVTCDDLKAAKDYLGNNCLATELFAEVSLELLRGKSFNSPE
jgi:hypothetical protein